VVRALGGVAYGAEGDATPEPPEPHEPRRLELPRLRDALSARESDILRLLAAGASNRAIAQRLHLSVNTVRHHVTSILGKLGAATRREAAARVLLGGAGDAG
jgi:DNA-binding NarL/FixJ family response regulator